LSLRPAAAASLAAPADGPTAAKEKCSEFIIRFMLSFFRLLVGTSRARRCTRPPRTRSSN
jgi:hypothetical protein